MKNSKIHSYSGNFVRNPLALSIVSLFNEQKIKRLKNVEENSKKLKSKKKIEIDPPTSSYYVYHSKLNLKFQVCMTISITNLS